MYTLYLPQRNTDKPHHEHILAADIGGTKTSLGLFETLGDQLNLLHEETYSSKDHLAFEDIVNKFLLNNGLKPPVVLSIGVAGPVQDNTVKLTNLDWVLDARLLEQDLGIAQVVIINDLEATAYGLAGLGSEDVATLFEGSQDDNGDVAILAPGTGLGEAGLFWDGSAYRPFATEGGHSDFAPRTALDIEFHAYLREQNNIVSWEDVVSGQGIFRIYRFLRDVKGYKEPSWLKENFKAGDDPAAVISHAALRELDATCAKAMELYVSYMARESTSLVLKHKATGGLLLGGGIPPRIYPLLRSDLFRQQFIQNSKMTPLLEKIPIRVILNSKSALIGAAYYGAFGSHDD